MLKFKMATKMAEMKYKFKRYHCNDKMVKLENYVFLLR